MEREERLNILMVDDQPGKLLSYEAILSSLGENLIKAGAPREALQILLSTEIDIILVDVSMPELDGFELAHLVRQHPRYQKTPMIFISAERLTEYDYLKGYEAGAVDYVSVPVIPEILRAKVSVFAELYRKTRQLERLNEELERRVLERTADLNRRADELQRLNNELTRRNEELDAFGYVASHDLKEPLRGIGNYAHVLLEDYQDKLAADGVEKLHKLIRMTQRMSLLIDALLHYARLGRAALALNPCNIQAVVEETLDLLASQLQARNVEVRIPQPLPTIAADWVHVGEIFSNLISNAIKYNDKAKPWIEIGCRQEGQGEAGGPPVFYVRDNGIGIDPAYHSSIFHLFRRLHGREEFGGGGGAGLTIVLRIIDRHGGRIWVESVPGEGSTFFFTFAPG